MRIRTSLRNSLAFHFIAAAVFPVLVIGMFGLHYLTETLTRDVGDRNMLLAKNVREEVRGFLREPLSTLSHMGQVLDAGDLVDPSQIDGYLEMTVHDSPFFESIYILDKTGHVKNLGLAGLVDERRRDYLGLDLSHMETWHDRDGASTWSDTFISLVTGEPALTLNLPLKQGTLVGNFGLARLSRTLEGLRPRQDLTIAIADRHGTLIAHSDQERALQQINIKDHPEVRAGLSGHEGTSTHRSGEERVLDSIVLLPETSWLILVSRDLDQALAPVLHMRNLIVTIMILTTLIGVVIALLVSRRLLRPLAQLTRSTRSLAEGDCAFEPPPRQYLEIDELAEGFAIMSREIGERQSSLQESKQRYHLLFNGGNDAVYVYHLSTSGEFSNFIEVNDIACQRLGYSREEHLQLKPLQIVAPEKREAVASIRDRLLNERHALYEMVHLARSGKRVPVEVNARLFTLAGKPTVMAIARDLSERKLAESAIEQLAYFDGLTRLPNRLLLEDRLNQALTQAGRDDRQVAILFLDLDRFKVINDTMGHGAGDHLLQCVAERIAGCVRKSDTVARLGGDEFAIVLTSLQHTRDAAQVAQNLLDSLAPPIQLEGHETFVTASIGIALYPMDGEESDTLLKNADTAMNHAKEQGRNSYQFFSSGMNLRVLERLSLETSLRRALERQEFLLHYQPKIDAATGRVLGLEALLRWDNPEIGLVPPDKFIPLAEETGLIIPIGEWVLHTACAQNRQWQQAGFPDMRIAVNLSPRQLKQHDFTAKLEQILIRTGLSPEFLDLELTESSIMENTDENIRIMNELRSLGVRLSVDDFGTGYSSLSQLRRFPIHTLKIDKSFIRDVGDNPEVSAIVEAIISMAHSLKLTVVAEGVEKAEQCDFLSARRCDELQGYYFARPTPAQDLPDLLAAEPLRHAAR